jgi:hypothetical protein
MVAVMVVALSAALGAATASADDASSPTGAPAPLQAPVTVAKPQPSPGKFFVHANVAFNAYTFLGSPYAGGNEVHVHPGNRAILFQQLGFGYFFHKMLRVQLTVQFGETMTDSISDGKARGFSLFSIIPWLIFTTKGFVLGIGPQIAPVTLGQAGRVDGGLFMATGYTFKLPKGFVIGPLVQLAMFFRDRVTAAVSPAVIVGYRF